MKKNFYLFLLCFLLAFAARAQNEASVPYTCDFEDATENAEWTLSNGNQTNQWFIGTAANNTDGGANALYISNNAGVGNSYTINTTTSVYAYRTFALTEGTHRFSFDWQCNGESTYDYLRVFLVTVNK